MNLDEALTALKVVEKRLAEMERELNNLRGEPCDKCGRLDGAVSGVEIIGGFEAVLCRFCRNDWAVVADESGFLLDYRKATEHLEIAREHAKTSRGAGVHLSTDPHVEALVAVERKLFQLAKKWITGGAP